MKTLNFFKLFIALLIFCLNSKQAVYAQSNEKSTICILNFDVKGLEISPEEMGNIVRLEVQKINKYIVIDRYDVIEVAQKENLSLENCYSQSCLINVGKALRVSKMLSGSVELFGKDLVFTIKVIDVEKESIEKLDVQEFVMVPNEIRAITEFAIKKSFGIETNLIVEQQITKKNNYDNLINTPTLGIRNLDGPRMGFVVFTGDLAGTIQRSKEEGGFDKIPIMTQLGYQFEYQYLSKGSIQGLIEFVPILTGLDQSICIPSLNLLHGLRDIKNGWEFAIGPSFYLTKKANVYYNNDKWNLVDPYVQNPNGANVVERTDSRGKYRAQTNFIIAIGKTFRSGALNIPMNLFVMPNSEGFRFGLSFGFNVQKEPVKNPIKFF